MWTRGLFWTSKSPKSIILRDSFGIWISLLVTKKNSYNAPYAKLITFVVMVDFRQGQTKESSRTAVQTQEVYKQ